MDLPTARICDPRMKNYMVSGFECANGFVHHSLYRMERVNLNVIIQIRYSLLL